MQNGNISPIRSFFRNKWVLLVLAMDIAVVIFIIAISADRAARTAVVYFDVAPVDAVITVNGSGGYENSGQALESNKSSGRAYSFRPGTYDIQISHADLDTKSFTINLEPDSNTTIITFLSRDGDFYFYTLRDNYGSFVRLAGIASAQDNRTIDHDNSAEAFIADFQKEYELYSTALPVTYSEYDDNGKLTKYLSVRASYDCDVTLCLKTSIYDESEKKIVQKILTEAGFNLEDFVIEYQIY